MAGECREVAEGSWEGFIHGHCSQIFEGRCVKYLKVVHKYLKVLCEKVLVLLRCLESVGLELVSMHQTHFGSG